MVRPRGPTFELFIADDDMFHASVSGTSALAPVVFDAWSHVAHVYDGTTSTLYVDGVFGSSLPVALGSYSNDEIVVGCDIDKGSENNAFGGMLDDVRLYDRALPATEILRLSSN
jgi:hypothetical protein